MYKFLISLIVHPKSKFSARSQIRRFFLHIPVGLLTALLLLTPVTAIGVVFFIAFVIYELNEDLMHLHDAAYIDLRGFLFGLGGMGTILLLLHLLGIM